MDKNVIYCGDCKKVMVNRIPDESVDLIYIDPPFFSNKKYEVIWGDGYEKRSFEDRWKGGIYNYIAWMEERIRECHRVLKPTGLFYLHCDYHASHYLKVNIDKIFGEKNFRNEIVWCYSGGGIPRKDFPRKHDIIFRYSKSSKYTYNPEYKSYTQGTLQRGRTQVKGKYAELRKEGTPVTDWWTDIKYIHSPTDKEKLGYPTQKSEELLERIIKTSSTTNQIVLDPMCGCGTAIAVAERLKRKWIGIDVSPTACKLMVKRMKKLRVKINNDDIISLPRTLKEIKAMKWDEFQNWVCEKILARVKKKKVGDMGIDGWTIDNRPIQVKQSESVGRKVVDEFETAMRREKKNRGMIVAFSFTKGAREEVARAKLKDGLEIELLTAKEILENH